MEFSHFCPKTYAVGTTAALNLICYHLVRNLKTSILLPCLFVLRFYNPVNPMGSCRAQSVYLTTRLLSRLKTARWVANSEDPDQMLHSVASDLGLHCSCLSQGLFWPQIFVREKIPFGQKQWEIFKFSEIFFRSLGQTEWDFFFFFFFFCKGQILYQNCMY